jgi:hypothetical protein
MAGVWEGRRCGEGNDRRWRTVMAAEVRLQSFDFGRGKEG